MDRADRQNFVLARARGRVGAPTVTHTPLKREPRFITKQDLLDYVGVLAPLIKSLHVDDMLPNLVYKDHEVEHAEVERLLKAAQVIDGCTQGLTCPGWYSGMTLSDGTVTPENPKDPSPPPTNAPAQAARKLRQEAFQHRVDARFMEERIDARVPKLTREQWRAEVQLWKEWNLWRETFNGFWIPRMQLIAVPGPSDWTEMQRKDLELQVFRDRYSAATKMPNTMALPPAQPASPDDDAFGLKSFSNIIFWLGVGVVGYFSFMYVFPLFIGAAGSTKGALKQYRAS